ncbi:hypothetical protein [Pelagicoccus sp. SDUM812003]|uniref:tetratricopeptide repeat protein n=1 Tax=Pelagicoccus sp. SDUM812003 TaxID=3041267 RepID=UPI00280D1427|nr:hypothetical protein [Pelagicoccus sp. SDUM812003]MDQ8204318.1 hypothetical protein [Pelagicoccus sp. SDUM812003]
MKPILTSASLLLATVFCLNAISAESQDAPDRLYPGFGDYVRPISTKSEKAQKLFNQGIQLMYGFNHDEAIRSFHAAAQADPTAAMPWWGIAYSHGININDPAMTDERSQRARAAADEALARLENASPAEVALIRAVSQRYAYPAPEDRRELDEAFAAAMGKAFAAFPNDPDVGTIYADSLMNLQPWNYWDNEGNPIGRIDEITQTLETVLANRPDHPGANHFYIHAVEASQDPNRAETAADTLRELVPGAGHLVHMPSHIYIRIGRYSDAVDSNANAIEADRAYFAIAPKPQMYSVYYAHNQHFLAYAAMMSGRYADAMKAARDLEAEMPEENLKAYAGLIEGIMPTTFHVMIRFGKWEDILNEPAYAEDRLVSNAVRHYARSIAFSATGRTKEAREEIKAFDAAMASVPEDWYIFINSVATVLPIARAMIQGELLYREGKYSEAYEILRQGIAAEDELIYDEPPGWMLPVRHALGALLMEQGHFAEAEKVYREDIVRNRDNGWGLLGLQNALLAQGKNLEAAPFATKLERVWRDADTFPSSSCFCAPFFATR